MDVSLKFIEWDWILMGFLMGFLIGFHGAILVKASRACSRRLRSVRFFRPSRPGQQSTSRGD